MHDAVRDAMVLGKRQVHHSAHVKCTVVVSSKAPDMPKSSARRSSEQTSQSELEEPPVYSTR